MLKLVTIATVAVAASAAWTYTDTPLSTNEFVFDYTFSGDVTYGTEYDGGIYTESDAPSPGFYFEKQSLYGEVWGAAEVKFTFLDFYQYNVKSKLSLLKFSPYEQWVLWFDPRETGNTADFDANIYASTYLKVLNLETTV